MGNERFEVVVIGGGAAGLSGAVVLARARREVLVIDAGRPRNAPADGVHSYLTRDGMSPADLVDAGRAELRGYGGRIREGTVERIDKLEGGFRVHLAGGSAVEADRLLVATGVSDRLPPVPGLAARWGKDVLHCPYCHGWEVRDEPIAILATSALAVHQALMWRQWSPTVTLLRHTAGPFSPDDEERLAARGIAVVDGEVAALDVAEDRLVGVALAEGASVACRALVVASRMDATAPFLADLGLEPVEMRREGEVIGTYVEADPMGATSQPGVWVAGNVANLMAQVVSSAEAGVRAAGAINMDLIDAETDRALGARRLELSR
ncbi:NAD(P)/FAD-dependent oxidoreductase [Glycomyces tarimensis]